MLFKNRILLVLVAIVCILWATRLAISESLTSKVRDVSEKTKLEVKQRDNFQCVVCGDKENLQIDHKIPLWKGGSNDIKNLQTLCIVHHRQKSQEEMKEYKIFVNDTLQKNNYSCSYCGARAPPSYLELTFKTAPEHGGIYTQDNLKTICKSCASKPKAIKVNGSVVEEGKSIYDTDFIVKTISENKVTFANSKNKDNIVHKSYQSQ